MSSYLFVETEIEIQFLSTETTLSRLLINTKFMKIKHLYAYFHIQGIQSNLRYYPFYLPDSRITSPRIVNLYQNNAYY